MDGAGSGATRRRLVLGQVGDAQRLDGGDQLRQGGDRTPAAQVPIHEVHHVEQGDALSWNAGSPYTMQNRQRAPLSLLLSIGAQGVLPTVREPAPAIADRSQYAPDPRFSEGGPMRLVAMRAHRRATRSG